MEETQSLPQLLRSLGIWKLYHICFLALLSSYSTSAVSQKTCVLLRKPVSEQKQQLWSSAQCLGIHRDWIKMIIKYMLKHYLVLEKSKMGDTVLPSPHSAIRTDGKSCWPRLEQGHWPGEPAAIPANLSWSVSVFNGLGPGFESTCFSEEGSSWSVFLSSLECQSRGINT